MSRNVPERRRVRVGVVPKPEARQVEHKKRSCKKEVLWGIASLMVEVNGVCAQACALEPSLESSQKKHHPERRRGREGRGEGKGGEGSWAISPKKASSKRWRPFARTT